MSDIYTLLLKNRKVILSNFYNELGWKYAAYIVLVSVVLLGRMVVRNWFRYLKSIIW